MIIVEFVGLSGCGKSTLCKKVIKELKRKGIRVASLQKTPEKGYSFSAKVDQFIKSKIAIHSRKNQRFLKSLVDELIKSGLTDGDIHQYWVEKILMLNNAIIMAERFGVQIGMVDEGFLQFVSSILNKREASDHLYPLIDLFKKEIYKSRTVFVKCELEPEKCLERMRARGRGAGVYCHTSDRNAIISNLLIRKKNLDFELSAMESEKQVSVRMEGDDNIESVLELIYQEFEKSKSL